MNNFMAKKNRNKDSANETMNISKIILDLIYR